MASRFSLVTCVTCVAVLVCACGGPSVQQSQSTPTLTISEKTTFVTAPLSADGTVDFVAAYNELAGAGVTRENNAAAGLFEAFGIPEYLSNAPDPEAAKAEYLRFTALLGVQPADTSLPYCFLDSDPKHHMPWRQADLPEAARQLEEIQSMLDAGVAALQRPEWFLPCAPTDNPASPLALPSHIQIRALCKFLGIRGMYHMGEGDAQAAWRDIRATARMVTLTQRETTLIGWLVSLAGASRADASIQRLAWHVSDRAILEDMLAEVANRPAFPVDRMFLGDRINAIAVLHAIWQSPEKWEELCEGLSIEEPDRELSKSEKKRVTAAIRAADPNVVLREYNRLADEYTAILQINDRKAMIAASDMHQKRRAEAANRLLKQLPSRNASPETKTQWCADVMSATWSVPAKKLREFTDRAEQIRRITLVAVALELHKLDHGAYPDTLDALSPAILPAVPTNLFTGLPMIYRAYDNTYDLYCTGTADEEEDEVARQRYRTLISETMRLRAEAAKAEEKTE